VHINPLVTEAVALTASDAAITAFAS